MQNISKRCLLTGIRGSIDHCKWEQQENFDEHCGIAESLAMIVSWPLLFYIFNLTFSRMCYHQLCTNVKNIIAIAIAKLVKNLMKIQSQRLKHIQMISFGLFVLFRWPIFSHTLSNSADKVMITLQPICSYLTFIYI